MCTLCDSLLCVQMVSEFLGQPAVPQTFRMGSLLHQVQQPNSGMSSFAAMITLLLKIVSSEVSEWVNEFSHPPTTTDSWVREFEALPPTQAKQWSVHAHTYNHPPTLTHTQHVCYVLLQEQ